MVAMIPGELERQVRDAVEPFLTETGVELVELTLRRQGPQLALRLLVDKVGGVTLGECSALNTRIGELVDRRSLIAERYVLEVSSPGLDRPLTTKNDFLRHVAEEATLAYRDESGAQRTERVRLCDVWEQFLIVERPDGERFNVPLARVVQALLVVKLS